jgi:hypothetical protein
MRLPDPLKKEKCGPSDRCLGDVRNGDDCRNNPKRVNDRALAVERIDED